MHSDGIGTVPASPAAPSTPNASEFTGWVVDGEPGPNLIRLYFSIALVILAAGAVTWVRAMRYWIIGYSRASVLIQSYIWLSISDGVTVFMYCVLAVGALIQPMIPSDAWWCQTTGFVSMAVSYSLSSAYVGISIATLAFVRQRGDGIFFARLVHALSMSGWVMGAGISILFAVRDQFGSYRNLYCMIPLDKYDKFAIGLSFAFLGATHILVGGVCLVAFVELRSLQRSHDKRAVSTAGSNGPEGKKQPFLPSTIMTDADVARNMRMRAIRVVFRNTSILLTIFWIAYFGVLAIGVANAMHIHVHPVWDVISALLVKSQPLFDNFFIMRTLRQLVEKLQPELQVNNKASRVAAHVKSHELADASVNLSNRAMDRLFQRALWTPMKPVREENIMDYKGLKVSGSLHSLNSWLPSNGSARSGPLLSSGHGAPASSPPPNPYSIQGIKYALKRSFGHAPTSAVAGKVPPLRSRVSDATSNRRTDGRDSPTGGMSPRFSTPGSPLSPPVYGEGPMQMYSGGAGAGGNLPSPRLSGTLKTTARTREKMPTEAGIPEETSGELRRSKSSSTSGHSAGSAGGGLVAAGPSGEGHTLASSLTRIVTPRGQRAEPTADRENRSAAGSEPPMAPVPPLAPLEVEGWENGTPVNRAGGLPFVAVVPPDPLMPEGLREEARGQGGNESPTHPSGVAGQLV